MRRHRLRGSDPRCRCPPGLSDETGSWKIICIALRACRSCSPCSAARSTPFNRILPLVTDSSCMMARPVVVLPQPDSPTMPRVSPLSRSKLTPETACTTCFLRAGNSTTSSVTLSTTSLRRCAVPVPAIRCPLLHRCLQGSGSGTSARWLRRPTGVWCCRCLERPGSALQTGNHVAVR